MDEKLVLQYYSWLYAIIVGSFVVVCLTSGQTNPTAVTGFLGAYAGLLLVFSGFCVLLGMSVDSTQYTGLGFFSKIIKYILLFLPFLVVMAVVLWVVVLLNIYFDKIIQNKVSDYYTSFINITSLLVYIQVYVLISELTEKSFKNFELPQKTAAMLRLFGLLNIISVFTLQIILQYYTTDC